MKKYFVFVSFVVSIFHLWKIVANEPAPGLPILNIGIHVIGEKGETLPEASISTTFRSINPGVGSFTEQHTGLSLQNEALRFQLRGLGTFTEVNKEGYWETWLSDDWREVADEETGHFLPEIRKDISLVLREKRNPRPLFVHSAQDLHFYELGRRYGYDLERGDLVRPFGRGVNADLILTMTGDYDNDTREFDIIATISFPNDGDGIFPVPRRMLGQSQLLLGQEAPLHGYLPTFELRSVHRLVDGFLRTSYTPNMLDQAAWEGLWFRTHTELDPVTGEVVQARYGKMYANLDRVVFFGFGLATPRKEMHSSMSFIYFYAPDHSRSLEFNGETLVPNGNLQGVNKR